MRNCVDEGTLQAWFDGELAADAAVDVTQHLHACITCAEAARMLEAENSILSEGLSLEFGAAIPTERLRQRVDAAVAGLPLVSTPATNRSWADAVRELFPSFRVLAYASIVTAVFLGGLLAFIYLKGDKTSLRIAGERFPQVNTTVPEPSPEQVVVRDKRPPELAANPRRTITPSEPKALSLAWQERQYERAIARLNKAIQSQPPLRPSLEVEYQYNLALVDNAIATTRDVARKNPRDPQAAQFMRTAYQSKVDLMSQIADGRILER
ncbi:MAG TPA: hypothetical protein VKD91_13010 [Pyrinomonadaceae bacterium]|nr:hypothetical protein [Pyrinomonadaceae bacterium]